MPDPGEPTFPVEPLRLVHHHPGRLRVRADGFRGPAGTAILTRAEDAAAGYPGVTRCAPNPFTGGLLIEYEPGRAEPGAILAAVAAAAGLAGVVDEDSLRRAGPDAATLVVAATRKLNNLTRTLSNGRMDLRSLIPLALLGGGVASLLRAPLLPRWDNLLYWSYSTFRDLHKELIEAANHPSGKPPEGR